MLFEGEDFRAAYPEEVSPIHIYLIIIEQNIALSRIQKQNLEGKEKIMKADFCMMNEDSSD